MHPTSLLRFLACVCLLGTTPLFAKQPADPMATSYQWHLGSFPIRQGGPTPGLDLPLAWDITRGTAYVGVVDNGIDLTSVDLTMQRGNTRFYPFRPQFAINLMDPSKSVDEKLFPQDPDGPGPGRASERAGHGTHVAGLIAAAASDPSDTVSGMNPVQEGTAGVCWRCSLVVIKASDSTDPPPSQTDYSKIGRFAEGILYALHAGAQVISLSAGASPGRGVTSDYCASQPPLINEYANFCSALTTAEQYQVPVVAATGNENRDFLGGRPPDRWPIDFPASDPRVIAVGGIDRSGARWEESGGLGSNHGTEMVRNGVVAPARDIASSIYSGAPWNAEARCGDEQALIPGNAATQVNGDGYGPCTGTSMATPLVTGVVALMRSVNPLASSQAIKDALFATSSDNGPTGSATSPNRYRGRGVPSARLAVERIRNQTNPMLLTPLFALTSVSTGKNFYTIVPQMARAALQDTLLPKPSNGVDRQFASAGMMMVRDPATGQPYIIPGSGNVTGTADVWVHTTYRVPGYEGDLIPLHRFSRHIGGVVDHAYGVGRSAAVNDLLLRQYQLDGIEGYLYPMSAPKPQDAITLFSASKDPGVARDFAIFTESRAAVMFNLGYRYGTTALGYAYPNTNGVRPVPAAPTEPPQTKPLAPVAIRVNWDGCFGRYRIEWNQPSDNAQWFELERRVLGTPANAWNRIYRGNQRIFWYDIGTQPTEFRVRACNDIGCSAYNPGSRASYVPQCPSP